MLSDRSKFGKVSWMQTISPTLGRKLSGLRQRQSIKERGSVVASHFLRERKNFTNFGTVTGVAQNSCDEYN